MTPESPNHARELVKSAAMLQLKLLLDALRDLALSPLSLVAAGVDLALLKLQAPRYFRAVLRLGHYSDHWIDVWSGGRDPDAAPHENVDALLARVEEVIRDPHTGARRARILKRWAERQLARARQRAALELAAKARTLKKPDSTPGPGTDAR
jgi:hypothetical protein